MIFAYIFTMAIVTYLIRAVPLTLMRKKITSPFFRSFIYYVPYACLTAMIFPAVLYVTESVVSAAVSMVVAIIFSFKEKGLMTVAVAACAAVGICEFIMRAV